VPTPAQPRPDLDALKDELVAAFARSGHPIRHPVTIRMQRGLSPEATSFRNGDGFVVLVSDRALREGSLGLLVAHELGHVQRMDAGHPSHDDDAITAAYASLPPSAFEHEYQRAILHHAINFTQDL
jgi:hypothetical protein